jgi:hypothetical protein
MKGHKLFIFLISGTLLTANVSALGAGDFPSEIVKLLTKAFTFLIKLLQNQTIRNGLSLILLAAVLYQVYAGAIRMIKVLSGSAGVIAAPLSAISTLAIYWKVKPEVISTMFLWLAAALGVIYLIKGFMWLGRLLKGGGFSPRRAIYEQKNVKKKENESLDQDKAMHDAVDQVSKEVSHEKQSLDDNEKTLKKILEENKDLEKYLRKIYADTKSD